jgi:probable rRNA maturation factor
VKLQLDIQQACREAVPPENDFQNWIETALEHRLEEAEVSLRLVDEAEMNALNLQYRDQDKSTNVLSFPANLPAELQHPLLGDIVICPAVVAREAIEQHKTWQQHWTHMLVHGSLHLLGYDHMEAADAEIMETLETSILQSLGWPCPYGEHACPATDKSATQ